MDSLTFTFKMYLRRCLARMVFAFHRSPHQIRAIRVLSYHDISDDAVPGDWAQMTTPKPLFAAQMAWLKQAGYQVLDACEAVEVLSGRKVWPVAPPVVLTFDDAFQSYLTNAWPILERHGFPSTLFLPTGLVEREGGRLRWAEIQRLVNSGLVSCGSHTVTHRRLRNLQQDEVAREVRDSKRHLEDRLQRPITLFAYPYGSYNAFDNSTVAVVAGLGFRAAFTTIAGLNRVRTDLFRLCRTRISWVDQPRDFELAMAGAFDWYAGYQWMTS